MKNDYFAPVRVRSTSASTRTKSHLSACQISFGKGASVCKKIGHEYEEYDHCRYLPVQSHFSWYCTRTDSNTAALSENRLLSCTSTRTTSTRTVLRTVRNVTMSRYYNHMRVSLRISHTLRRHWATAPVQYSMRFSCF